MNLTLPLPFVSLVSSARFWFRYLVVFGGIWLPLQNIAFGQKGILPGLGGNPGEGQEGPPTKEADLANKIRDGEVSTEDIPAIILHAVDFFLMIAGGIAVIMIMVGGVQLVIGGLMENKDSGKKTLQYAVIGLFVAFFSWFAVDQVQKYLTAAEV